MASSPTQRSLAHLRKLGFIVGVVEQNIRIPPRNGEKAKVFKRDLYGIFDLIAAKEGEGIIAIQTTSYSNVSSRITKIRESPNLMPWLRSGGRVRIHGWHKPKHRWVLRDEEITEEDFLP